MPGRRQLQSTISTSIQIVVTIDQEPESQTGSPLRSAVAGGFIAGAILVAAHAVFIAGFPLSPVGQLLIHYVAWPLLGAALLGVISGVGSLIHQRVSKTDVYRDLFKSDPLEIEDLRERHRWTLACLSPDNGEAIASFSEGAVAGSGIVIGRSREARVQLRDDSVSRQHARLILGGDGSLQIVDLESGNGVMAPDSSGEPRYT